MSTADYHEDEGQRLAGERHAGIVTKDGMILMMHRIKNGYEYYVFPGGHRREGDAGEETVEREVYEETGIRAKVSKLAFEKTSNENTHTDYYYLCDWISGNQPALMGEEVIRNSKDNFFEPMWVKINQIESLNVLPEYSKEWILKDLAKE